MKKIIFEEKYGIDLLNDIKLDYTTINGNNNKIVYQKEYSFKGTPKNLIISGDNYEEIKKDYYNNFSNTFKINCKKIISDMFYELNLMKIFEDGDEYDNRKMLISFNGDDEDHMHYINIEDIKENYVINLEIPDEEYSFSVITDNGKLKSEHSNICFKLYLSEKKN